MNTNAMKMLRFPLPPPGWIPFLFLAALQGCLMSGREGPEVRASAGGGAEVRLLLTPAALVRGDATTAPAIDSVRIRVTAEDMAPMEFSFDGDSLAIDLEGLPPGEGRLIDAYLFRSGRLLYSGRGVFTFSREARVEAALRCDPLFSRVTARFHLPLGMPVPVSAGLLKLSGPAGEYSSELQVRDEFGSFRVDELPGDASYDVAMSLSDSVGKVRYQAERSSVFLPLGEEAKWDMNLLPSEASAGIALSLGNPKTATLQAAFPSRRRPPRREGEAVVSEFYAAPSDKDSASQGEWFELFNRSADTLQLGGCRLSRDRSGGVTRSYPFDSALALLPGRAMVFGRSAAPAEVHYGDFSLVNTSSALLLLCAGDSLRVDSLFYSSSAADSSAVPMREGEVSGLDASALGRRGEIAEWCLTKPGTVPPGEAGAGYASPGSVEECLEGS